MLYLSLVLSSVLLLMANVAVHRRRAWLPAFVLVGVVLAFGPVFIGLFLPPVALMFLCLGLALLPWYLSRRGPWLFLPVSCLAASIAFGLPLWSALKTQREYALLR